MPAAGSPRWRRPRQAPVKTGKITPDSQGRMAMDVGLFKKVFGTKNTRELKRMQKTVARVNALEPSVRELSDADLKARTAEFRDALASGATVNAILPEVFAVAREASRRARDMRHFDVQIIGGITLHEGRIAEIQECLARADVIDTRTVRAEGKVVFGVTVELCNLETDENVRFQIVGEMEADIDEGLISVTSPLAKALIGKREGDVAVVRAPAGEIEYEILEVAYP